MTQSTPWYIQYHSVKKQGNWRTLPLIRHLRAMQLRRLKPLGEGRHGPMSVIRYYWADFLEQHRADFRGRALEIGETATIRYYGENRLSQADAIDLSAHSEDVRVVADLSRSEHVASDQYDCFLVQFTTNVLFDIEAALYHAIRLLKPGGVLLTNFWTTDFYFHNGLDMGTGAPLYMHHWFTPIQVENLLRKLSLTDGNYQLLSYGNLLTKTAFLMNLPARELTVKELDTVDPGQPLLICARIVKPMDWNCAQPVYREPLWLPNGKPIQMREDTGHFGDAYLKE